jgi:hypothetical protein
MERDNALRDLHTFQLEAQSWKQEVAASKASVRLTQIDFTDRQFIYFWNISSHRPNSLCVCVSQFTVVDDLQC